MCVCVAMPKPSSSRDENSRSFAKTESPSPSSQLAFGNTNHHPQAITTQFNEFLKHLTDSKEADDFWTCATSAVGDTTRVESGYGYGLAEAPTSLFVATDSKGLCQMAQKLWNKAGGGAGDGESCSIS